MKHIRNAKQEDCSRIAEIEVFNYRLNFYPIFRNDQYYFRELQVNNITEEYLCNPKIIDNTYVYDDGVIKGFISIDEYEIKKLFVEPVLQSQLIGSELLDYALNNHKIEFLWALEKNSKAISFYKKHGFHITNERKLEDETTEYLVKLAK